MILSLDFGSRRMGAVCAEPILPLRILRRATIAVDPDNLDAAVALVDGALSTDSVSAVVAEHAPIFMPIGLQPQAYRQIAAAHEVCSRLHERVGLLCKARDIPMHTIARQTWAHRVVPHHQGGISDALANAGLLSLLGPDEYGLLQRQDERDACGALLGHILPVEPRKSRYKYRDRRKDKSQPRLDPEARAAAKAEREVNAAVRRRNMARDINGGLVRLSSNTCNCGPDGAPRPSSATGRHKCLCPCAPPPRRPLLQRAAVAPLEDDAVPPTLRNA